MLGIQPKFRALQSLSLAALLCASPLAASPQQTASAATPPPNGLSHSVAQKTRVPGVPNFGEVTPTLYRGAQPTKRGFESLSKLGVAIVAPDDVIEDQQLRFALRGDRT